MRLSKSVRITLVEVYKTTTSPDISENNFLIGAYSRCAGGPIFEAMPLRSHNVGGVRY